MPIAATIATLNLQLLQAGDYQLRVQGTVFTYDQNPDNDATYDAFEVFLNGSFNRRFSNQTGPLNCDTEREVTVDLTVPLASYGNSIALRFENHNRFDNFYNTYTNIETVWVEKK